MRGVAYALTASVALVCGALTSASAGCYGECNGYQDNRYGPPAYERPYREPVYQGSYDSGPRYHTTYYERGEEYPVSYREYPAYRSSYDDGRRRLQWRLQRRRLLRAAVPALPRWILLRSSALRRLWVWLWRLRIPWLRRLRWVRLRLWLSDGPYRRRLVANCIGLGYGGYGYGGYGYGSTYAGWGGGCSTTYIPYGWNWARARSC